MSLSPHDHPSFDLRSHRARGILRDLDLAKATAQRARSTGGPGLRLSAEEETELERDISTTLLGEQLVEIQRAGLAYRIAQLDDESLERVEELYRQARESIDARLSPESRNLLRAAQGFGAWIERLYAKEPSPDIRAELFSLIERAARRGAEANPKPEEGEE